MEMRKLASADAPRISGSGRKDGICHQLETEMWFKVGINEDATQPVCGPLLEIWKTI